MLSLYLEAPSTLIRFQTKTETFCSGYDYRPHYNAENDHRKRILSEKSFARSAASRPKKRPLRGLTYSTLKIHEVDLWQVYRKRGHLRALSKVERIENDGF